MAKTNIKDIGMKKEIFEEFQNLVFFLQNLYCISDPKDLTINKISHDVFEVELELENKKTIYLYLRYNKNISYHTNFELIKNKNSSFFENKLNKSKLFFIESISNKYNKTSFCTMTQSDLLYEIKNYVHGEKIFMIKHFEELNLYHLDKWADDNNCNLSMILPSSKILNTDLEFKLVFIDTHYYSHKIHESTNITLTIRFDINTRHFYIRNNFNGLSSYHYTHSSNFDKFFNSLIDTINQRYVKDSKSYYPYINTSYEHHDLKTLNHKILQSVRMISHYRNKRINKIEEFQKYKKVLRENKEISSKYEEILESFDESSPIHSEIQKNLKLLKTIYKKSLKEYNTETEEHIKYLRSTLKV